MRYFFIGLLLAAITLFSAEDVLALKGKSEFSASSACGCNGGNGTCTATTKDGTVVGCGKSKNDTCTGRCGFLKATGGGLRPK